ncbi:hypothetical protein DSECCO2_494400 [anaerobic digester metagenome]
MHIVAKGVVAGFLQLLEQLDQLSGFFFFQQDAVTRFANTGQKVALGHRKLLQRTRRNVQHIALVRVAGGTFVQRRLPDEKKRTPVQGVELIFDKEIAAIRKAEQNFDILMKVGAIHVPGIVPVEAHLIFCGGHDTPSFHRENEFY